MAQVHTQTDVDAIRVRIAKGGSRWLTAAFSSIFMGSGTLAMGAGLWAIGQVATGDLFMLPFVIIPGLIGGAHFYAGANGVREALEEVELAADLNTLTITRSIGGIVPIQTRTWPLNKVAVQAVGMQLKVVSPDGVELLPGTGQEHEIAAIEGLIAAAVEGASDLQMEGEAPEALRGMRGRSEGERAG